MVLAEHLLAQAHIQTQCICKLGKIQSGLKLLSGIYYWFFSCILGFDTVTALCMEIHRERAVAGQKKKAGEEED